jgi:SGNH hydrolase-like domain, acetyltransferase AlgX
MENDLHLYSDFLPVDSNSFSEPTDLPSPNLPTLKAYLNQHSALYAMFTRAAHRTTALRSVAVQLGLITPNLEGIGDENISRKELTSSLLRLRQIVAGRDVVVLVIPSRRLWVGASSRRANAARVHSTFVDGLREYGMTVVDIRNRMEAGGNPLSYHFANDGHWNATGHRLAAEALSEVLKQ